ncbi:hypothetical protein B566_EDAN007390 [Ephemera danica]|nr:hypothetical protein B566_EDAN007390 [Ephemera danica]
MVHFTDILFLMKMSTMVLQVLTLLLVLNVGDVLSKRPDTIFMNQFAVHVPSGEHAAQRIADTHGFNNLGQDNI